MDWIYAWRVNEDCEVENVGVNLMEKEEGAQ